MTGSYTLKRNGRLTPNQATVSTEVGASPEINQTKFAILITFLQILVKGKIHYCEPHPDTTIELLAKYHNIQIHRRWFFQCMLDLETAGFMRRQRRWREGPDPDLLSNTSLWWFTIRGARFLCSKMIRGSQELLKSMLNWIHRGDDRLPTAKDLGDIDTPTTREEALEKLHEIYKKIGAGPAGGRTPTTT